ncbi:MAG: hypothetical protein V3R25_05915 [Nitrosomonadaceae bacterium]
MNTFKRVIMAVLLTYFIAYVGSVAAKYPLNWFTVATVLLLWFGYMYLLVLIIMRSDGND